MLKSSFFSNANKSLMSSRDKPCPPHAFNVNCVKITVDRNPYGVYFVKYRLNEYPSAHNGYADEFAVF